LNSGAGLLNLTNPERTGGRVYFLCIGFLSARGEHC
jgi:hypothetical protein